MLVRNDYSLKEASEKLGASSKTVGGWISQGHLVAERRSKEFRVSCDAMDDFRERFSFPPEEELASYCDVEAVSYITGVSGFRIRGFYDSGKVKGYFFPGRSKIKIFMPDIERVVERIKSEKKPLIGQVFDGLVEEDFGPDYNFPDEYPQADKRKFSPRRLRDKRVSSFYNPSWDFFNSDLEFCLEENDFSGRFLGSGEVASKLGVAPRTACKLIDEGYLIGTMISGERIVRGEDFDFFREEYRIPLIGPLDRALGTFEISRKLGVSGRLVCDMIDEGHLKGYVLPGLKFRRVSAASFREFARRYNLPTIGKKEKLLTTSDASLELGLSVKRVCKFVDEGLLKGFRIPGSIDRRILKSGLRQFEREYNLEKVGSDSRDYTIGEVSRILGINSTKARKLVDTDLLKGRRLSLSGNKRVISRNSLGIFMKKNGISLKSLRDYELSK